MQLTKPDEEEPGFDFEVGDFIKPPEPPVETTKRRGGRPPRSDVEVHLPVLPDDSRPSKAPASGTSAEPDRRFRCKRYNRCLDYAYKSGWPSFHCLMCNVQEMISRTQERSELEGFAEIIKEVFRRR